MEEADLGKHKSRNFYGKFRVKLFPVVVGATREKK
jgi:hypothetical protein